MMLAARTAALAAVACIALAACNDTATHHPAAAPPAPDFTTTYTPSPTPSPSHKAVQVPARGFVQPNFTWSVAHVTAAQLGKSWHAGCPVGPASLRALAVSYWDFNGSTRTGTLVVNVNAVTPMREAFKTMFDAHFPFRSIVPIAAYGGDDNRSMAADNTSAFNCRYAVANGPKRWSMHAFGEAVDLDPRENPYTLDGRIYPPNGAAYTSRNDVRRGMVVDGSAPVRAFSAVGWGWGGRWSSSPDYQHFSSSGQ